MQATTTQVGIEDQEWVIPPKIQVLIFFILLVLAAELLPPVETQSSS
jgi:hypothetical protein